MVFSNSAGEPAAIGLVFWGRPHSGLRPWADLVVTDASILPDLARMLGPGASLMVSYEGDDTEWALRRKVPPQATPLGLALLAAGCRWLKDWYFPEGGLEGGTKLQGTIPLGDAQRRERSKKLLEELEIWEKQADRKIAHRARGWVEEARKILLDDIR